MAADQGGAPPAPIVVIGGGVVGASIAYYLALRDARVVVLERETVACAASGKAGGFLARSWGDGSETEQLHHVSFDLHAQLARDLRLASYRALPTLSVSVRDCDDADGRGARESGKPRRTRGGGSSGSGARGLCSWLDGPGVGNARLMDRNTAQVTPLELTTALLRAAAARGTVRVREGARAVNVCVDSDGVATAVALEGGELVPCSQVVLAMGPWTVEAEKWARGRVYLPMIGICSSSLVFRPPAAAAAEASEGSCGGDGGGGGASAGAAEAASAAKPSLPAPAHLAEPFALFCGEDSSGCHLEVYPRPDGSVYVCGLGGSEHWQADRVARSAPRDVQPNAARAAIATATVRSLGAALLCGAARPAVTQACLRPCTGDALPAIGALPTLARNAWVAAGHNCWGVLWAPATGRALSEAMLDGRARCLDLAPFAPDRFPRD